MSETECKGCAAWDRATFDREFWKAESARWESAYEQTKARASDLAEQVQRWEDKEVSRATHCWQMEKRAEAAEARVAKLTEAVMATASILSADDASDNGITDTVWAGPGMTLLDLCQAALAMGTQTFPETPVKDTSETIPPETGAVGKNGCQKADAQTLNYQEYARTAGVALYTREEIEAAIEKAGQDGTGRRVIRIWADDLRTALYGGGE